jgi:damage-control phosphatase, subfamily II, stand-alone protein
MAVLCRLADPDNYTVSTWNLGDDPDTLSYWLDLFTSFAGRFDALLAQDDSVGSDATDRWEAFVEEYRAGMERIAADAHRDGRLYTIDLCRFRQKMLNAHGFPDPYHAVKDRENDVAADLYPSVVARIDETPHAQRGELLFRAVLAGNMFDLGCPETIAMYHNGQLDFLSTCQAVPARPWFLDDADALIARLTGGRAWRRALIFVDNAGADIVLGVVPLARELVRAGTRVTLAANNAPALNDITIDELNPLLDRLAMGDAVLQKQLAEGLLDTVDSGGDTPLIDLSRISDACNAVAADSDLILLEGMGRGVESNWTERFTCDVWRFALLKDHTVVRWLGARLFDPVCRYDPVNGSPRNASGR